MVKKFSEVSDSLERINTLATAALDGGSGDVKESFAKIKNEANKALKIV